jgi:putative ABC transport system permease protein
VGRLVAVARLVLGDIKRRPAQAALLLVMIMTTTTTLALGLALRTVSNDPFARTRAASRGPDVVADVVPPRGSRASARDQLAPLLHAHGVAAASPLYPVASVTLTAPGVDVPARGEGRDSRPAAIDQPALASGSWVRPGGAVIERGFATALGLRTGETIRLNGHRFTVTGTAVSTAQCFYPVSTPGVIWLTRNDAERLATPQQPLGYLLELRLKDPTGAEEFAFGSVGNEFFHDTSNDPISYLESWRAIRHEDFRVITIDQKALLIGGSLLALLALASIAVAVGGRMAEQTRRVGLLKAVGASPRLVAAVLLAENLLLALAAAAVGLAAGELLAPLLTNLGTGMIGSPPAPALTVGTVLEVAAVAVIVAGGATVAPAIRGARTSTIRALNDPARPPRRRPWVIAASARLPVPMLLALRLVARRPRRAALSAASLAIAVTMVVAALTLEHRNQLHVAAGGTIADRVSHLVVVLSTILVVLASVNAIFTTWATVIDSQRANALARALGATPAQVSAGLTASQLLPGLLAACAGIPAGLALYALAGGHLAEDHPPIFWLLAVIPGTLVVVAAVTAIPARLGATRSPAEVLRSD